MVSESPKTVEPTPSPSPSFLDGWKERIFMPTLIASFVGGGAGFLSKHRNVHGLANISATYATNLAIVTGCYCGAREFVRTSRQSDSDDLLNSALAGFGTGAILGRFQGGPAGAIRYSIVFTIVGTTADYAILKIRPYWRSYKESVSEKKGEWLKLPEWSPIQVLDEEALAAKQAEEKKLYEQRAIGQFNERE